jgi:hypothetical protein
MWCVLQLRLHKQIVTNIYSSVKTSHKTTNVLNLRRTEDWILNSYIDSIWFLSEGDLPFKVQTWKESLHSMLKFLCEFKLHEVVSRWTVIFQRSRLRCVVAVINTWECKLLIVLSEIYVNW